MRGALIRGRAGSTPPAPEATVGPVRLMTPSFSAWPGRTEVIKKLLFLNKFRCGSLMQNSIYVCSAAIGAPPNNLAHTLRCADKILLASTFAA
jgi:hypothetical protein